MERGCQQKWEHSDTPIPGWTLKSRESSEESKQPTGRQVQRMLKGTWIGIRACNNNYSTISARPTNHTWKTQWVVIVRTTPRNSRHMWKTKDKNSHVLRQQDILTIHLLWFLHGAIILHVILARGCGNAGRQTDGRTDERTDRQTHGQTAKQKNWRTDGRADG